jgi:hypothetical protein
VLAIAPTVDVIVLLLFFSWQISEGLRFHNVYMNIIYMHIYMIRNITLYIYTRIWTQKYIWVYHHCGQPGHVRRCGSAGGRFGQFLFSCE